ncbi:MAG TPA: hypothetical protein VIV40_00140 [Kofleriaceae bacterium]
MRWGFALVLALACGCHSVARGGDDDDVSIDASGAGSADVSVFDPAITNVAIEIDYETGKAPYTGTIIGFGDTFEPTQTNLDRLFAGKKTLTIPSTLGAMEDIGNVADEEITIDDIFALAAQHRVTYDTDTRRGYYVIFLGGYFADATGVKSGVLGISIGNTIAMFKDVIDSTNVVLAPNVVRYVEQSTLIHELAHSIGLVDNGVHMAAAHKDAAHGAHCDNQDCVMFWQNDGSGDAAQFAQQKLLTGSSILFDANCLADVDALSGGP